MIPLFKAFANTILGAGIGIGKIALLKDWFNFDVDHPYIKVNDGYIEFSFNADLNDKKFVRSFPFI